MSAILTVTDRERDLAERLRVAEKRLHEVATACATAEQQRDEMAAQVEVMRLALENARSWHRCDEWRDCDDESNRDAWQMQMNRIDDALALPNTAATILRLRDARTLREAAAIAVEWGNARKPGQGGHALWNYADHIRTKADELESKNG